MADTLSRESLLVCKTDNTKEDRWYTKTMKMMKGKPEEHPEYSIKNGRLYRHVLHMLDFNEQDPADEWKICVIVNKK